MEIMDILFLAFVGLVAGILAGIFTRGKSFDLISNIIVGVIGSFIGEWLFGLLDISIGRGIIGDIITAFIGAVLLLILLSRIRK